MKKIFSLTQKNKHPERVIESIKYDIRRYVKRERKKRLPDEESYWKFDCRFGQNSDESEQVTTSEIITRLDKAREDDWDQCYIEIIAKVSPKPKKKNEDSLTES